MTKAPMRRFGLFGPPGIVFLNRAGKEMAFRVIGRQPPIQFLLSLDQAGTAHPPRRRKYAMDVLAHALWAGAGVALACRRWPLSRRTAALTVTLAVAPDVPHLLPILGWTVFGDGTASTVKGYAIAIPGQEPVMPSAIEFLSHNLHCVTHSAIVLGVITALYFARRRQLWIPLLGWWSHVVIDMFTHSADYYPSPILWPITRQGFDGIAWNTPWFMGLNYAALLATYLWLWRGWNRNTASTRQ